MAPPGWWFNGTGDVERVLSPAQTRSFDRLVATLDRDGGMSPHFDVRVLLGDREITDIVRTEINAHEDERAIDLRSSR